MKKLLVFALTICMVALTACTATPAPASQQSLPPAPSVPSASSSSSISESSSLPSSSSVELVPTVDKELSVAMEKYLFESFGGSGNTDFSTSWYSYIGSVEVLKKSGEFYCVINLTEKPGDYSLRLILSQTMTDGAVELCIPPIMDATASLGLDEVDGCLIGESLATILTETSGLNIHYASLLAYEIPSYQYLANAMDVSVTDVMDNIDVCNGSNAVQMLIDGMTNDYGGSYKGLLTSQLQGMTGAAIGFKDVTIKNVVIKSPDGKIVRDFDNLKTK